MNALIFEPFSIKHYKQYYRYVTCGMLHADFFHLFVNMFVLYSFGQAVEYYYAKLFGQAAPLIYLALYVSAIFVSNISTYYKYQNDSSYRALGASGAVSAVVFTSILFNPYAKIYLYGIVGLPGILLGVAYLGYSYYMTKKGSTDNINHEAHLQGALYGLLFTIVLKPTIFMVFINQLF